MQIQDTLTSVIDRVNALEKDVALLKMKTDNHEQQMLKIEASITALTNIRTDITNIQKDMAVNAAQQQATIKAYSWMATTTASIAGAIIYNWSTIKGFFS